MTALSAEYTESFRLSLRKLNQEWSKEYFLLMKKSQLLFNLFTSPLSYQNSSRNA